MHVRNAPYRVWLIVVFLVFCCVGSPPVSGQPEKPALAPSHPPRETRVETALTFAEHVIHSSFDSLPQQIYDVEAGDLDRDGDVDVASANATYAGTYWLNTANEQFDLGYFGEGEGSVARIVDLDDDGDNDFIYGGVAGNYGRILWGENDGDGNLTRHVVADDLGGVSAISIVDLDRDGDRDILAAITSFYASGGIRWWENDGAQNFAQHSLDDVGNRSAVDAGDLDGDGDIDVVGTGIVGSDLGTVWWENDGTQQFTQHTLGADWPRIVEAVDLDHDGVMDVLGEVWGTLLWWKGTGGGSFTQATIYSGREHAFSMRTCDVDGDGDMDILTASPGPDGLTWWENDGSQAFIPHTIDPNGYYAVDGVDFDRDGDVDILGGAAVKLSWWETEGHGPIYPLALVFGTELTELTLHLNPESPSDAWTLSETVPWLALSDVSGTGPYTVTATVDRGGLPEGLYSDTIDATVGGAPATVDVTMRVATPVVTIITPASGSTVYHSDSLLVKAAVTLAGQALTDGAVEGEIGLGEIGGLPVSVPIDLFDDGAHEDGAAADGIYASRIALYGPGTMPTSGNPYSLTVTATAGIGSGSDTVGINLAASSGAPTVDLVARGPSAPDTFAGEQATITATLSYPDASIHTDTGVTVTVTAPDLSVAQVGLTNVASDTWRGTYTFGADLGGLYYLDARAAPPEGSGFVDGWDGTQVEVYRDVLALNVTIPPGTYYRSMPVPLAVCVTGGAQPVEDAAVHAQITPGDEVVELVHTSGGCYSGNYHPTESSAHQVAFTARDPAYKSGSANGSFTVSATDPAIADAVAEFANGAVGWSEATMDVSRDVAETGDWFAAKVTSDKARLMIEFSMDTIALMISGTDVKTAVDLNHLDLPGATQLGSAEEILTSLMRYDAVYWITHGTSEGMDDVVMSLAQAPYRYYATGGAPDTELVAPRDYIEDRYATIVPTSQSLQSNFYGPLDASTTQLQADIQSRAIEVAGNLPSLTVEQEAAYVTDFARRQHAHQWLAQTDLFARSDLMFEVQAKREAMEEDDFRQIILFLSEAGLKVGMTRLFGPLGDMAADAGLMGYHAYVNTQNIEQDQHFRDMAVGLMGRAHNAQSFIGSNTLSGLNLVEQGTPPETPAGGIVSTDVVRTAPAFPLDFLTQDIYADLQIENTGSVPADYAAVAYYTTPQGPGSYRQVLREMTDPATGDQLSSVTLSPGSQDTIRLAFVEDDGSDFGVPKYGVYFVLYALTDRGAYVVDIEIVAPFEPRTEATAMAAQMASIATAYPRPADVTAALSLGDTISPTARYPLRAMVGSKTNQLTYTLSIAADNPFPMPIAVVIRQTIPSTVTVTARGDGIVSGDEVAWYRVIPPRETILLEYAFAYDGNYAAEAALPPAHMRFYDAADDVTVTLNTGPIVFYARSPLRARATASTIVEPEMDQTVPVTVTNLDGSAQQGDLGLHVWTITGTEVSSTTTPVSLGAETSQHHDLVYTSPGEGLYVLEVALQYGGETTAVIRDLLRVRGGQVYLPLVLDDYAAGDEPANHAPATPSNPSPPDGATGQDLNVDLSWTGGDPDGDSVTYDVYFTNSEGAGGNLICNDVSVAYCDPGTLSEGVHHYWRVVATDEHGATTTGPVWDFTTSSARNLRALPGQ